MKLTWFARTTLRIHIGGHILVVDPDLAPAFVDRGELLSGADRVLGLAAGGGSLPVLDPMSWRPRLSRPLDEFAADAAVHVRAIGPHALLVDAPGEAPLVLLAGETQPRFGRWADGAVVALIGFEDAGAALATALLEAARPKLIALAGEEPAVDRAFGRLAANLGGAALVALEPGLALEV
jgi:hypothetical protein